MTRINYFAEPSESEANALRFTHREMCYIAPEKPSEVEQIPLTNLDLLMPEMWVPVVLFFANRAQTAEKFQELVQQLKSSLAKVLVPFYPMAGRIVYPDSSAERPHFLCNDEGVPFTEAWIDAEMKDFFGDENFKPQPQLSGMKAVLDNYNPRNAPAVAIQVTYFQKCGGVAVQVTWSHTAADGFSGFHFFRSWAEMTRKGDISLAPDHRRELFHPRNPPKFDDSLTGVRIAPGNENFHELGNLALCLFPVAREQTQKIKEEAVSAIARNGEASSEKPFPPYLTTADCMSAYIWQSIIQARGLDAKHKVRFMTFVDGRKRFLPSPEDASSSLPHNAYFGNFVCFAGATTTAGALLSKPLAFSAALIHEAVSSVSSIERYRATIDFSEAHGRHRVVIGNKDSISFSNGEEGDWVSECISSWWSPGFVIYGLDFGWGPPDFGARNGILPVEFAGAFNVIPSNTAPGDVTVFMSLENETMPNFQASFLRSY